MAAVRRCTARADRCPVWPLGAARAAIIPPSNRNVTACIILLGGGGRQVPVTVMQEQVIEEQVEVGMRRVAVSPPQYYNSYERSASIRLSTEYAYGGAALPPQYAGSSYAGSAYGGSVYAGAAGPRSVGVGLMLERDDEVRRPCPRPHIPLPLQPPLASLPPPSAARSAAG